jgi:hypothetical protein
MPEPAGNKAAESGSTTESSIAETTDETTAATTSAPAETGVLHRDRIEMRDTDYVDLGSGKVGLPPGDDFYLHGTDELVTAYPMAPVSGPITKATVRQVARWCSTSGSRSP